MSTPKKLVRIRTRPYLATGNTDAIGTVYATSVDANGMMTNYSITNLTSNFVREAKFTFEQPNDEEAGHAIVLVSNGAIQDLTFYANGSGYSANDVLGYIYPISANSTSIPLAQITKDDDWDGYSDTTIYVEEESS